jgi:hypothetical protein
MLETLYGLDGVIGRDGSHSRRVFGAGSLARGESATLFALLFTVTVW